MFKTRITELLGIEYPIIQGAMLWLSRAELASAVSNAGGLGIIDSMSYRTSEDFRQELKKMKSLTNKPFAVNITLLPTRTPVKWGEYISVAIEEGVRIFETSGRSPGQFMERFKDANAKVMHKVARTRDAKTAERLGVDAVTIVGFEAGGHPGMEDVASLVRIPTCVDSLNIPVIAGGGIADGRGMVAALALGAEGVLMGTRFMASQECDVNPRIKELLLQTGEADTVMIQRSLNMALRVIRTDFSSRVLEMEAKGATLEELFPLITGTRTRKSYISGDTNDSVFTCGQSVGLVHEIPSVKEIIESIISEAKPIIQRLHSIGISA